MSKIKWDPVGERFYETGCDHGVLYPQENGAYPKGYPWSGLTNVTESPSGAESNPQYADNMIYLNLISAETFGATIECFTYPDEFDACNGQTEVADGVKLGQQRRNSFGFTFRTKIGNDTEGDDYGYKLHLIYGCLASPSEESHATINDSPEASTLSYEVTTTPIPVSGKGPDGKPYKPTSRMTIDSRKCDPEKLQKLEDTLYGTDGTGDGTDGTDGTTARLPLPDEVIQMLAEG